MRQAATPAGSTWLRGLHMVLTRRMRLERRGFLVTIVPEPLTEAPETRSGETRSGTKSRRGRDFVPPMPLSQLADAHADLKAILDEEPDARRLRPTLALLERALDKDCEAGIDQIPAAVLRHAAQALDQLQDERYSPGLVVLRRRVAVVLRRKHAGVLLQDTTSAREPQPDFSNTLTEFVDLDDIWEPPTRRGPHAG